MKVVISELSKNQMTLGMLPSELTFDSILYRIMERFTIMILQHQLLILKTQLTHLNSTVNFTQITN